jgi:hypothetical protein
MIRKQLYLTAETERRLKAEAKRRGVSEAQVIRERLDGVSQEHSVTARFVPDPDAVRQIQKRMAKVSATASRHPRATPAWKFSREELYEEDERMQRLHAIADRAQSARAGKADPRKRPAVKRG